jgi:NAD(P)-dependent dehydrogenase (short-subunit alcohol dehydrogenase family)
MSAILKGHIVAVTGGASGIGAACCHLASAAGARVAVLDIDEEGARRVAHDINNGGGTARSWGLDVRDAHAVDAIMATIEADLGAIDGLVASAGILDLPGPPEGGSIETWDNVVAVNQRGVYLSCLAAGRRMATRGKGAIVTIASVAGMRSMPLHSYAPAKAAVISITQNLAVEWGRSGVRVNAVSPGYTRTPALQGAIDSGERDPTALVENSALGRLVEPSEIAEGVIFLLSPLASAITGVTLPVDAGWLVAPSWHTYGGVRGPKGNMHAES